MDTIIHSRVLLFENEQTKKFFEINAYSKYYDIEAAKTGDELLNTLLQDADKHKTQTNSKRIEVVVLDSMMPNLDGFEVLRKIRNNPLINDVKVIMIGSKSEAQDLVDALFAGASDYVVEPIKIKELIARIENQIKRKREDDNRREIEARYQAVMSMAEGVIVQDTSSNIITLNPSASTLLGINAEQNTSKTLIPPDWSYINEDGSILPINEHPATVTLLTGQIISDYTLGIKKSDNQGITWLSVNTRPLIHEGATLPYAVVSSFSDITKRKRAEDALKESEEKFRALTISSPIAIFIIRNDNLLYVNPAFETITGYNFQQLKYMSIWELIHPDMHIQAKQRLLLRSKEGVTNSHGEYKIVTKNGDNKWVDISITPLVYQEKFAFMGSGIDISEQKKTETILWETRLMGELGTFANTITDEINELLEGAIKTAGYLHNISTKLYSSLFYSTSSQPNFSALSDEIQYTLSSNIDTTTVFASQVTQATDLLKSYKSISSKYSPNEKRLFNLHEFVNQTIKGLKPILKEKHHQILFTCPDNLYINTYPDALMHIITNLIKNSISHAFNAEQEGIIKLEFQSIDRQLVFNYNDNGKGLDAAFVNQFFDSPFLQQFKMINKGIGIFIIYNLVSKILNGNIDCESEQNQGTKFIIKIPL